MGYIHNLPTEKRYSSFDPTKKNTQSTTYNKVVVVWMGYKDKVELFTDLDRKCQTNWEYKCVERWDDEPHVDD